MRKLIWISLTCMLMLVLHSCLNDDTSSIDMGTIRVIEGKNYYLQFDNGKNVYPADTTAIHNYKVVNGQRVLVYYDYLDGTTTGYDYTIRVTGYVNILTKDIIPLTTENAESIGDDRINITQVWRSDGYLTFKFYFYGSYNPAEPHLLNLVQNQINPPEKDRYIHLEFRHNSHGDSPDQRMVGYVSFKLDKVTDELDSAIGFKIRVNTIEEGEKIITLDFPEYLSKQPSASALREAAHSTGIIY